MNWKELDEKLHLVEEFEKSRYFAYQIFRRESGYETADAEEKARISKMWEENRWKDLDLAWIKEPVVLSYTEGKRNQLVQPMHEENKGIVLHSRKLVAEEEGIRKWMMIQKHPRFSVTFEHSHSFVEINYMYSGSLINYVNGHPYVMEKGDIMIMEPGCHHSMNVPEEDDILINFVLFPSALATLLDKLIPGESALSRFLINALERGYGKNNFVSLRTRDEKQIHTTVKEILCEYMDEGRTGSEAMVGYLVQEFFTRLWRFSEESPDLVEYGYAPDNKAVQILSYIKEHAVDCTRESVAEHFGYSGSRISNLLTEQFGKSFVTLRNEMRLEMIEEKLKTTDLPVQQIAEQYGISNQTHFYRMYREYFGRLPRQKA